MTEKEIQENNALIAEFMNFENNEEYSGPFFNGDLRFHESFDWIMPVLEKIEQLGASTEIHYFAGIGKQASGIRVLILGYNIDYNESIFDPNNHSDSKIQAVYKSVVKFIKWYNNENKRK